MENIIKEIRTDNELTQTELATISGCGYQTIFDLEHFNRAEINEKVLQVLEKLGQYEAKDIKYNYDYQRQQYQEEKLQELA